MSVQNPPRRSLLRQPLRPVEWCLKWPVNGAKYSYARTGDVCVYAEKVAIVVGKCVLGYLGLSKGYEAALLLRETTEASALISDEERSTNITKVAIESIHPYYAIAACLPVAIVGAPVIPITFTLSCLLPFINKSLKALALIDEEGLPSYLSEDQGLDYLDCSLRDNRIRFPVFFDGKFCEGTNLARILWNEPRYRNPNNAIWAPNQIALDRRVKRSIEISLRKKLLLPQESELSKTKMRLHKFDRTWREKTRKATFWGLIYGYCFLRDKEKQDNPEEVQLMALRAHLLANFGMLRIPIGHDDMEGFTELFEFVDLMKSTLNPRSYFSFGKSPTE